MCKLKQKNYHYHNHYNHFFPRMTKRRNSPVYLLKITIYLHWLHWLHSRSKLRSSHQRCSVKKGVLRNFTKFTRKYQRQRPQTCNFIKKETLAQVFSCEFCEISKTTFSTEHLQTTVSQNKHNGLYQHIGLTIVRKSPNSGFIVTLSPSVKMNVGFRSFLHDKMTEIC